MSSETKKESRKTRKESSITKKESAETKKEPTKIESIGVTSLESVQNFLDYKVIKQMVTLGGEADIYLVEKGETYILKLYRFGLDPKEEILKKAKEQSERFSEHIIRIYDYGLETKLNRWYEIQEYAKFGSLKEAITDKPNEKLLRRIVSEISEGLKNLHDANIVHRDIKPTNILVRKKEPLNLVFTDFGVSTMLMTDLSKKLTGVRGTFMYSSPESFSGIIPKESDYWSLGMLLLELLTGKNPMDGIDPKLIQYHLTIRGIEIPETLLDSQKQLLMGLLTRDPKKRWKYSEIQNWLKGDHQIPVYYEGVIVEKEGVYKKPFPFLGTQYKSIKDLVEVIATKEENWKEGIKILYRGTINNWLENNEDYPNSNWIHEVREREGNNKDFALFQVIYKFNPELPFHIFGKYLSIDNFYQWLVKDIKRESSSIEKNILQFFFDNSLQAYRHGYQKLTNHKRTEADDFKHLYKATEKIQTEENKKKHLILLLEIYLSLEQYILPKFAMATEDSKINFIDSILKDTIIELKFVSKSDWEKNYKEKLIPKEISSKLENCQNLEEYKSSIGIYKNRIEESISRKDWLSQKNNMILPLEYIQLMESDSWNEHKRSIPIAIAQLPKKEWEENNKRYQFPKEVLDNVYSNSIYRYNKGVEQYKELRKFLDGKLNSENYSLYLLPDYLMEGIKSDKFQTYIRTVRELQQIGKENLFILKSRKEELKNTHIIPEKLYEQIQNSRNIEEYKKNLIELEELIKSGCTKKEWEENNKRYQFPKEVLDNVYSNSMDRYNKGAEQYKELRKFLDGKLNSENYSLYLLPDYLVEGIKSDKFQTYIQAVQELQQIEKENLFILKSRKDELKNTHIIPEKLYEQIKSSRNIEEYKKNLIELEGAIQSSFTKREWNRIQNECVIPKELKEYIDTGIYKLENVIPKKLIDKNQLKIEYEKYYFPEELYQKLNSDSLKNYNEAIEYYLKIKTLPEKVLLKESYQQWRLPEVVLSDVASKQIVEHWRGIQYIQNCLKSNEIIYKKDIQKITILDQHSIEKLIINSSVPKYDSIVPKIKKIASINIDYHKLKVEYLIPKELDDMINSTDLIQAIDGCIQLIECINNKYLVSQEMKLILSIINPSFLAEPITIEKYKTASGIYNEIQKAGLVDFIKRIPDIQKEYFIPEFIMNQLNISKITQPASDNLPLQQNKDSNSEKKVSLVRELKDSNLSIHNNAIQKEVEIYQLIQKLNHKDRNVYLAAMEDLVKMGKETVPALIQALKDNNNNVRTNVALVLGKIGEDAKEAIPALIQALKDNNNDVRTSAALALGKIAKDTKEAIPALIQALKDNNNDVRTNAALALGKIGKDAKEAVPALIQALKDNNNDVRTNVAWALGNIGKDAKEAVPALIQALKDNNNDVRNNAAWAIGKIGEEAAPALIQPASDNLPLQKNKGSNSKKIIQLIRELKQGNLGIRSNAAETLGKMGSDAKEAIPALISTLKDNTPHIRIEAAIAIWNITGNTKEVIPTLIQTLKDGDWWSHQYATKVLGKIGKEAVPALVEALKDSNNKVRYNATEVLGGIGSDAKEAIPALKELSEKDNEWYVRDAAKEAIRKIEGGL